VKRQSSDYLHPAATGCSPEIGFCSHDYFPFLWSSARRQQFSTTASIRVFRSVQISTFLLPPKHHMLYRTLKHKVSGLG